MQSTNNESFLNFSQKAILIVLVTVIIFFVISFKNQLFQPNFLLKKFGESSIEPERAFTNNKPTFLEFYAEWCEVCKEMAPHVADIKEKYEKDMNFVFLNVDNPKWEKYIKDFNVNGIPQINLFDEEANLKSTFLGKQQEKTIVDSLVNLQNDFQSNPKILNPEFSIIKENKNLKASPRSHG